MARRSQFQPRSNAPRRSTSWLTGPAEVVAVRTTTALSGWTTGLQILEDGVTLIRTRGSALIKLVTTAGGTTDGMAGAIGIGVASENAFGVGATAIMDPFNDSEWDGWIWHSFFHVRGALDTEGSVQRIEIDSKAMRKIEALDVIYGALSTVETGVEVVAFSADTRQLFKLS